jgi:hypothetical protein
MGGMITCTVGQVLKSATRLKPVRVNSAERRAQHAEIAKKPDDDNAGGLKGSRRHWLAVFPPEFEIPTSFVAVD